MALDEQSTRIQLITPMLERRGWTLSMVAQNVATGRVSPSGEWSEGTADYVLFLDVDGERVEAAVVEARAVHELPQAGAQQARECARSILAPFAYASNGHAFVEVDTHGTADVMKPMKEFPNPAALRAKHPEAGQRPPPRQESAGTRPAALRRQRVWVEQPRPFEPEEPSPSFGLPVGRSQDERWLRAKEAYIMAALEDVGWHAAEDGELPCYEKEDGPPEQGATFVLSVQLDGEEVPVAVVRTTEMGMNMNDGAQAAHRIGAEHGVPLAMAANRRKFVIADSSGKRSRRYRLEEFPSPQAVSNYFVRYLNRPATRRF